VATGSGITGSVWVSTCSQTNGTRHDNVTLQMKTKATGRGAPHLILTTALDGSTIAGTYLSRQRGRPDDTGTFSVSR
jgi:hypothetical protein